jgi:predicted DsbA family dithiol-disulfide isomerase
MKRALDGRDVDVRVVHFPLSPDTPSEGRVMRPYLEAHGIDADAVVQQLDDLLRAEGLDYIGDVDKIRGWPTRKAHELAAWAVTQPGGQGIHDALFRAYHVDNVNLGDVGVLVDIAAAIGLSPDAARDALEQGTAAGRVDEDYALSRRVGVRSVPTFGVGDRMLVGAPSVAELADLVTGP